MNLFPSGRLRSVPALLVLPVALLASALLLAAGPASASAEYAPEERRQYFESGKYTQDLDYVADRARKWIIERTQPTIKIVRACRAKGFAIGKRDPGPDPAADYSVPVKVPKHQMPDRIIRAPKPGPGKLTRTKSPRIKRVKAKKAKRITKKRCRNMPKLAIAMDMDETAASSYRYGSKNPDPEASELKHLLAGTQTAIPQTRKLYRLAKRRGVAAFIITARPESEVFRTTAEANLRKIGYNALAGVYLRPPTAADKGVAKNSQRAEIVKRRGYRLIAMFGDQNSDLRTGFYERGFKYQSAVTPEQD
jgi:hypothetical protein